MKFRLLFIFILIIITTTTTWIYHTTQKADINYYQALHHFEKGEFFQAIPFYQKSLSSDPSRVAALIDLANCYRWTDNIARAITLLEKADSLQASNLSIKKSLAETYFWNKQYDEAKNILEDIIKNDPKDSQAQLLYAKVLQYSGDTKEAIELYKKLLDTKESNPPTMLEVKEPK